MVNARQFNILSEMGIHLWQQKFPDEKQVSSVSKAPKQLSLDTLFVDPFFKDVLICLGLTAGDVSLNDSYEQPTINLGLINWQFNEEETPNGTITFKNNTLITPALSLFSNNIKLKKDLWHTIQTSQLC